MVTYNIPMTETEFLRLLRTDLVLLGGAKLAEAIGVSPQHISDVKHGHRGPGPKVLAYYGLEKVVRSERHVSYVLAGK